MFLVLQCQLFTDQLTLKNQHFPMVVLNIFYSVCKEMVNTNLVLVVCSGFSSTFKFFIQEGNRYFSSLSEANSEPSQTRELNFFTKINNGFPLLTVFVKSSILDVWQGSEYASGFIDSFFRYFVYTVDFHPQSTL